MLRFVEGLDLSALQGSIGSVEGGAGHPAAAPTILVSLWLYATLRGVGSAREVARLCESHVAYQWLCGGVGMNHHALADFRTGHGAWLDATLTASVAVLLRESVVTLDRVAQDGVRVRASAGAASFRRSASLQACEAEATARAASDRLRRVEAALAVLPAAQARARRNATREARVSTADAEAHVMRMADGGFRPAYNVQLAADTASQVIVGVEVTTTGSDQPNLVPMADQIVRRHGRLPKDYLVDGSFVALAAIERLDAEGVTVYAPPSPHGAPARGPRPPS